MEGISTPEDFDKYFQKLIKLYDLLKEKGFQMMDLDTIEEELKGGRTVPIVHDGMDGVRASYNTRRGLVISFTNSFGDPNNSTRKEIESHWTDIQNS